MAGPEFTGGSLGIAASLYTTTPDAASLARRLQLLSRAGQSAADPLRDSLRKASRDAAAIYTAELERRAPSGRYPGTSGHRGTRRPAGRRYAQFGKRQGRLVRQGALRRTIRVKPSRSRIVVLIGGQRRSDDVWYVAPILRGHRLPRSGIRIPANPFIWDAARAKDSEITRQWQQGVDRLLREMERLWGTADVTGNSAGARRRRLADGNTR